MLNHPRRRILALSVLAMMLGLAFMPTLLAQRVAPTQQDAPLKTLTLNGKVGTKRSTDLQTGSRPRPLSRAQRDTLFKGGSGIDSLNSSNSMKTQAVKSFTLTPNQPTFSDKARIYFVDPLAVYPTASGGDAWFDGGSTGRLYIEFRVKAGQLYAIDISVGSHPALGANGIYTLTNFYVPGATQTIPYGSGAQHITAYVTPEQDGWLTYYLWCSKPWIFFSIEVIEL